ncbi:MAG: hypothetical protein Q8O00_04960 [Holophaga sp.]|nr:hypothetical protein [Holophaga sp.]
MNIRASHEGNHARPLCESGIERRLEAREPLQQRPHQHQPAQPSELHPSDATIGIHIITTHLTAAVKSGDKRCGLLLIT